MTSLLHCLSLPVCLCESSALTPGTVLSSVSVSPSPPPPQEYKRKQIEEQRQAERLQRQLQQERAYLVSLQQQQQEARQAEKKQLYHYKDMVNPSDKPAWAKEVSSGLEVSFSVLQLNGSQCYLAQIILSQRCSLALPRSAR